MKNMKKVREGIGNRNSCSTSATDGVSQSVPRAFCNSSNDVGTARPAAHDNVDPHLNFQVCSTCLLKRWVSSRGHGSEFPSTLGTFVLSSVAPPQEPLRLFPRRVSWPFHQNEVNSPESCRLRVGPPKRGRPSATTSRRLLSGPCKCSKSRLRTRMLVVTLPRASRQILARYTLAARAPHPAGTQNGIVATRIGWTATPGVRACQAISFEFVIVVRRGFRNFPSSFMVRRDGVRTHQMGGSRSCEARHHGQFNGLGIAAVSSGCRAESVSPTATAEVVMKTSGTSPFGDSRMRVATAEERVTKLESVLAVLHGVEVGSRRASSCGDAGQVKKFRWTSR